MMKLGKSFVEIGSRLQIVLFFLSYIEISNQLPPPAYLFQPPAYYVPPPSVYSGPESMRHVMKYEKN